MYFYLFTLIDRIYPLKFYMKESHTQYYSNYKTVNQLIRPKIKSDMTKNEIITSIYAGLEQVFELKAWNDRFISENIYKRQPENITSEEKDQLLELNWRMCFSRTEEGLTQAKLTGSTI